MRRVMHVLQPRADGFVELESADELDEYEMLQDLAGYILEQPSAPQPGTIRAWGYLVVMTSALGEPQVGTAVPVQPSLNGAHRKTLQLQPVGRLMPMAAPQPEPEASPTVRSLRPVLSGQAYRVASPPARGLVTPELAEALETVFERFSRERGFTQEKPLEIRLARGFKAGSHGHGEGRAADIIAVGSQTLLEWKQEWEQAMATAEKLSDPLQRAEAIASEHKRNLGYGLYKALQEHGGWRVNPNGWRVYRGVMQLFGPWTATEGPWKAMQINEPNPYQRQRLADQQWVFRVHQDHIHVAR
jgi:hypothetical protein